MQRRRFGSHLRGKLSDASARALSSHLESCDQCAEAYAAARDVNERIRSAIVPFIPANAFSGPRSDVRSHMRRVTQRPRVFASRIGKVLDTPIGWLGVAAAVALVASMVILAASSSPRRDHSSDAARTPPVGGARIRSDARTSPHASRAGSPAESPQRSDSRTPPSQSSPTVHYRPSSGNHAQAPPPTLPAPPAPTRQPRSPNLLNPSGFDSPVQPPGGYQSLSSGSSVSGWTVTGDSVDISNAEFLPPPARDPAGTQVVDLIGFGRNSAASDGIERVVSTKPGARYRFSFELAGNPSSDAGVKTGEVLINGVNVLPFSVDTTGRSNASAESMGWAIKTVDFVATSTSTTIWLRATSTDTMSGPVVTDTTLYRLA